MLKHLDKFLKYRDKLLLYCLAFMNSILTITYIVEAIQGGTTIIYVFQFITMMWGFYLFAFKLRKSKKYKDYTSWILAVGFIVTYAFAVYTTRQELTWIYFFAFACLLPLYVSDLRLTISSLVSFIFINAMDIIGKWAVYTSNHTNIVVLQQRVFCTVICSFFILMVCVLINKYAQVVAYVYEKEVLDMLTGFHGYGYIDAKIRPRIERNHDTPFTLIYIDIDNFKEYNNLYGRAFGDKILKYIAETIRQQVSGEQANASLCRFESDKFFVFIMNRTLDEVEEYYNGIKSAIGNIITRYKDKEVFVSATVTVTDTRFCPHSFEGLYMRALCLHEKAREKSKNLLTVDAIEV